MNAATIYCSMFANPYSGVITENLRITSIGCCKIRIPDKWIPADLAEKYILL